MLCSSTRVYPHACACKSRCLCCITSHCHSGDYFWNWEGTWEAAHVEWQHESYMSSCPLLLGIWWHRKPMRTLWYQLCIYKTTWLLIRVCWGNPNHGKRGSCYLLVPIRRLGLHATVLRCAMWLESGLTSSSDDHIGRRYLSCVPCTGVNPFPHLTSSINLISVLSERFLNSPHTSSDRHVCAMPCTWQIFDWPPGPARTSSLCIMSNPCRIGSWSVPSVDWWPHSSCSFVIHQSCHLYHSE